jgi:hypothetical protein
VQATAVEGEFCRQRQHVWCAPKLATALFTDFWLRWINFTLLFSYLSLQAQVTAFHLLYNQQISNQFSPLHQHILPPSHTHLTILYLTQPNSMIQLVHADVFERQCQARCTCSMNPVSDRSHLPDGFTSTSSDASRHCTTSRCPIAAAQCSDCGNVFTLRRVYSQRSAVTTRPEPHLRLWTDSLQYRPFCTSAFRFRFPISNPSRHRTFPFLNGTSWPASILHAP